MAADDEDGFIPLLTSDQLSRWSGGRNGWVLQAGEIRGYAACGSKPLVYERREFADYVVRFSAQVLKCSVSIFLRNHHSGLYVKIDTEKVWVHDSVEFFNKPGEWAEYEVRVIQGRTVSLLRNGKHSGFRHTADHIPETGKISLQLSEAGLGSDVVLRRLRIRPTS